MFNRITLILFTCLLVTLIQCASTPRDEIPEAEHLITVINENSFYPEGPLWINNKLYYTEYSSNRIMVYENEVNKVLMEVDGCGPSSLIDFREDSMLITCYDDNTLVIASFEGEVRSVVKSDSDGRGFKGPNDFVKDSQGGIYLTASGVFDVNAPVEGAIYYIAPDDSFMQVASDLHYPNGLALVDNETKLLINEHLANHITQYTLVSPFTLSDRQIFLDLSSFTDEMDIQNDYLGPDGLKVDSRGLLYICHYAASHVWIVNQNGTLVDAITLPLPYITNIAFGETEDILYITGVEDAFNEPYPGTVYQVKY